MTECCVVGVRREKWDSFEGSCHQAKNSHAEIVTYIKGVSLFLSSSETLILQQRSLAHRCVWDLNAARPHYTGGRGWPPPRVSWNLYSHLIIVCLAQWFLTVQQFSIEIVKCLGPLDQDDTLFGMQKELDTVRRLHQD
ncbi:PREDICTED: uncharacterized protein LOC108786745 [Nanorana parkeri]|uniref:uncharacterized protein LOC108786745 n=1 Tax=Nanorana parkeri TaxID=125878 RepID=UPI0008543709|nr:PREDICTED: uncharacterized protein LOC108786745 [Nanorana parkeri]